MLAILLAAAFAAGDGAEAEASGKGKDERRICRRYHNSSSRIGYSRVCKTAAEWKQRDSEDEQIAGGIASRAAPLGQGVGGLDGPRIGGVSDRPQ
jgi:hypothetical protein